MNVHYWDVVTVRSGDASWPSRGRVQITDGRVWSYKGSGNWDIHELAGWDADTSTVTLGDYVRTDWRS